DHSSAALSVARQPVIKIVLSQSAAVRALSLTARADRWRRKLQAAPTFGAGMRRLRGLDGLVFLISRVNATGLIARMVGTPVTGSECIFRACVKKSER